MGPKNPEFDWPSGLLARYMKIINYALNSNFSNHFISKYLVYNLKSGILGKSTIKGTDN